MYPFGEPVTFQAAVAGSEDAHGNPTTTYAAGVVVEGCAFDPGGSTESYEPGRNATVSIPRVFAPFGTVVGDRDLVTVRGLAYEVDGEPASWVNPYTGSTPGVVVNLKRVEG